MQEINEQSPAMELKEKEMEQKCILSDIEKHFFTIKFIYCRDAKSRHQVVEELMAFCVERRKTLTNLPESHEYKRPVCESQQSNYSHLYCNKYSQDCKTCKFERTLSSFEKPFSQHNYL